MTYKKKSFCLLCNKADPDDSKDGIPIHKACWYSWYKGMKEKGIDPIEALHDIDREIQNIKTREEAKQR